jgi:Flp pilus assembly protein TadG
VSRRDEGGAVIPLMALVLVVLVIFTAIVVDLGRAREQRREAQAAADAGALAGVQAIDTLNPPECGDSNCAAAFYTMKSLFLAPVAPMARTTCAAGAGETCWSYSLSGIDVHVTTPYSLRGAPADPDLVNVHICHPVPTPFGSVIGTRSVDVCASATAQRNGSKAGSGGPLSSPVSDCVGEDNLEAIIPGTGTVQAGTKIGAVFNGDDSAIDMSRIEFSAPDQNGNQTNLTLDPTGQNGYTVTTDPANPNRATISYTVPSNLPTGRKKKKDPATVYKASLRFFDLDQKPGPDCGMATWQFTADGSDIPTTSCGEDSFLATLTPADASTVHPGTIIGATFTDESPLNSPSYHPSAPETTLKFTIAGPSFGDGVSPYELPYDYSGAGTAGYSVVPTTGSDKYNSQIFYQLPDASHLANGAYTATLYAEDTDQNKAGGDCGQARWTFTVEGGTVDIKLIE